MGSTETGERVKRFLAAARVVEAETAPDVLEAAHRFQETRMSHLLTLVREPNLGTEALITRDLQLEKQARLEDPVGSQALRTISQEAMTKAGLDTDVS